MRVFVAILKTLARSSVMLPLFALALVALPLVTLLTGWLLADWQAATFVLTKAPSVSGFLGMLLGWSFVRLTDFGGMLTLPDYGRRLLRLISLLGFLAWLSIPLSLALGAIDLADVVWLRWAPLWSYGAMGASFLTFARMHGADQSKGPAHWRRYLWALLPLGFIVMLANTTAAALLNMPILQELPGFTPLAVICLLLGPLSWPSLLAGELKTIQVARAEGAPRANEALLKKRHGGSAFDTWYLSKLLTLWHSRERPRPEFLVLPPYLWSSWYAVAITALVAAALPSLVHLLSGMPLQAPDYSGNRLGPLALLAPMLLLPLAMFVAEGPRVGRVLLLPGLTNRKTLPNWLFSRLLSQWMLGAAMSLVPIAAFLLWFGMAPVKLALLAMLLFLLGSIAAALAFWRIPGMNRSRQVDGLAWVVWVLSFPVVPIAETQLFDLFSPLECMAAMGLAGVLPLTLYALALKRWKTMEYGA